MAVIATTAGAAPAAAAHNGVGALAPHVLDGPVVVVVMVIPVRSVRSSRHDSISFDAGRLELNVDSPAPANSITMAHTVVRNTPNAAGVRHRAVGERGRSSHRGDGHLANCD